MTFRVPSQRLRTAAAALASLSLAALPALPDASGASAYPSKGTGGLSWSASVPTDPQRDVGEPEIHIDLAGNIYTCGPSGFSNVADYMQVSTDGGDQFHLLGQAPRGQISMGEGGGDCGLASGTEPNAQGNYTLAYSGLGPLTNFSTFTSKDVGRTIMPMPVSESPPGVDRQWHVFTGPETVFLNYNQLAQGYTVQKSTDGGLTYGKAIDTGAGGGRIGPLRAVLSPDKDPDKAIVYFPSYRGSEITVTRSVDGGATWGTCVLVDSEMNPSAGFVLADHDSKGNVYVTWSEKGGDHDTWLTVLPAANLAGCEANEELGTGRIIRVNRDDVETTVMPWIVAGDEGRVAVAYFGTKSVGEPDEGSFVASWYPYVSMTLNALAPNPTWIQTPTTTHPFHYGSICLGGLGCDLSVPEGDRSLADYFAMDMDPITGRLHVVYGSAAKKPTDAIGHVSTATVVSQESGPSLLAATTIAPRRPVLRDRSVDPAGDALAPYSQLYTKPNSQNVPALDVLDVRVGPATEDTVPVTITLANLGDGALQNALVSTGSQSLVWLFRFLNGFQPAGATAAWSPGTGFTFGFDDFTTKSTESGQADPTAEKIIVWPQSTPIEGAANQDAGTITLNVPRSLLQAQVGPTGAGQVPELAEAADGSRFFDATVFAMGNAFSPVQDVQSYLYQVDSSPAMDFQVGAAPAKSPPKKGGSGEREDDEAREEEAREDTAAPTTIPTTGANGVAGLAALALLTAAVTTWRMRRAST